MSRCVVIMQPTFLPWAGFFNLIASADEFVFLDDVQFEKQSWQTRNRILVNGVAHWVGVPVRHDGSQQLILETEVAETDRWRTKLERSFVQSYGKHPYFTDAQQALAPVINRAVTNLAELNVATLTNISHRLGFRTRFHCSHLMGVVGSRTRRLVAICEMLGATEYLSPVGSGEYLAADGFTEMTSVRLKFQDFTPAHYSQRGLNDFVSHLSILDVLANLGWAGTREYVSGGPE